MLERKISVTDVSYCGEYCYGKKFKAAMNISKEREFVFVKEGSAVFTVDGRAFLLKAGEILFNCGEKIVSQAATGEGAKVVMEAFSGDAPPIFDTAVFRLNSSQLVHIENIIKLSGELEEGKKKDKALLLIALYTEILMTVLWDAEAVTDSAEYKSPLFSQFGSLYSIIENNMGEKLALSVLSEKSEMSGANIKRICRECAGCGVSELVSKMKLIRARKMLRSGMKAADTAEALGFENRNYFSSFFKREEGISLREYKGMIK